MKVPKLFKRTRPVGTVFVLLLNGITVLLVVTAVTATFAAASQIAFVHVNGDSDCNTLPSCTENLLLINPDNPAATPIPVGSF